MRQGGAGRQSGDLLLWTGWNGRSCPLEGPGAAIRQAAVYCGSSCLALGCRGWRDDSCWLVVR